MPAHYDMQCPTCGYEEQNVALPFGVTPEKSCPKCAVSTTMRQTFKHRNEVIINFGFREHMYGSKTDSDIAKFQFQNL